MWCECHLIFLYILHYGCCLLAVNQCPLNKVTANTMLHYMVLHGNTIWWHAYSSSFVGCLSSECGILLLLLLLLLRLRLRILFFVLDILVIFVPEAWKSNAKQNSNPSLVNHPNYIHFNQILNHHSQSYKTTAPFAHGNSSVHGRSYSAGLKMHNPIKNLLPPEREQRELPFIFLNGNHIDQFYRHGCFCRYLLQSQSQAFFSPRWLQNLEEKYH